MTVQEREDFVRRMWAEVPSIECKGQCFDSCGPIDMSDIERALVEERGFDVPALDKMCLTCPALDFAGRCQVYDVRPMICRLWGVTESMKCPHGCVPEGGHISDAEGYRLLGETLWVGGSELVRSAEELEAMIEIMRGPFGKSYLRNVVQTAPDFQPR